MKKILFTIFIICFNLQGIFALNLMINRANSNSCVKPDTESGSYIDCNGTGEYNLIAKNVGVPPGSEHVWYTSKNGNEKVTVDVYSEPTMENPELPLVTGIIIKPGDFPTSFWVAHKYLNCESERINIKVDYNTFIPEFDLGGPPSLCGAVGKITEFPMGVGLAEYSDVEFDEINIEWFDENKNFLGNSSLSENFWVEIEGIASKKFYASGTFKIKGSPCPAKTIPEMNFTANVIEGIFGKIEASKNKIKEPESVTLVGSGNGDLRWSHDIDAEPTITVSPTKTTTYTLNITDDNLKPQCNSFGASKTIEVCQNLNGRINGFFYPKDNELVLKITDPDVNKVIWKVCEEENCPEDLNDDRWEELSAYENMKTITIQEPGNRSFRAVINSSNNIAINDQAFCPPVFATTNITIIAPFGLAPESQSVCPGQKLKFDIYDPSNDNNYDVYVWDNYVFGNVAQYRQVNISDGEKNNDVFFINVSNYPSQQRYFIRNHTLKKTSNPVVINILPPGTHTANISGGQGINNETCLYANETLRLTADFCDGMIDNPDDWEFVWQEKIDGGEFVDMGAYSDITQAVNTKDIPHPGNTEKQEHTYRVVVRRASDNDVFMYLDELSYTFYPVLLNSFSSFTRHCTQLFVPDINEEYSECLPYVYEWDFGDELAGPEIPEIRDKEPVHKYDGEDKTYQVSLTVKYDCGCGEKTETVSGDADFYPPDDLFITQTKDVTGTIIDKTIQASASSLTDVWDLLQIDEKLISENPWHNGLAGIWRQDATFVYKTDRDYLLSDNTEIPISQAGTFKLQTFNWDIAPRFEIPGWKEVNTITNYSPYGYQTENKDVLGIYSAALYGTFGDFPLAVGQNTKELEMAYTGFETPESFMNPENEITKGGATLDMGNWILGQAKPPVYERHTVLAASENMTLIEGVIEPKAQYWILGKSLNGGRYFFKKANVHCFKPDGNNTVVTFDEWIQKGQWVGEIIYRSPATPKEDVIITDDFAHTGKYSFALLNKDLKFEQGLLNLEPGKEYYFSAWISNGDVLDTSIDNISINLLNDVDEKVLDISGNQAQVIKAGNIINGWQQISGRFIAPVGKLKLQLITNGVLGFFDDLRLHPYQGNMKSYVYDMNYYRLLAELDENNYATFYEYDKSGALQVVKKETERGIITVQESITNTPIDQ